MTDKGENDKFVRAYNGMLEQMRAAWHKAEAGAALGLGENIARAQEKASELNELTREESDRIAEYLRRDLEDAGSYLAESKRQLGDWLSFDLQFAESRLAEMFASVVDQSRVELGQWDRRLHERHTGEVTGIGILECQNCGETLRFEHTAEIPACPKCGGTTFTKRYGESD